MTTPTAGNEERAPDAWQVRRREDGEWGPWETCSEQTAAICQGLQSRQVRKLYAALPEQAPEPRPESDPLHDDAYLRGVALSLPQGDSRRWTLCRIADRIEAAPKPLPEQAGGALTAAAERFYNLTMAHDRKVRITAKDKAAADEVIEAAAELASALTTARATPAADVRDGAPAIRTAILGLPLDVWSPGGRARALAANPWPAGSETAGCV